MPRSARMPGVGLVFGLMVAFAGSAWAEMAQLTDVEAPSICTALRGQPATHRVTFLAPPEEVGTDRVNGLSGGGLHPSIGPLTILNTRDGWGLPVFVIGLPATLPARIDWRLEAVGDWGDGTLPVGSGRQFTLMAASDAPEFLDLFDVPEGRRPIGAKVQIVGVPSALQGVLNDLSVTSTHILVLDGGAPCSGETDVAADENGAADADDLIYVEVTDAPVPARPPSVRNLVFAQALIGTAAASEVADGVPMVTRLDILLPREMFSRLRADRDVWEVEISAEGAGELNRSVSVPISELERSYLAEYRDGTFQAAYYPVRALLDEDSWFPMPEVALAVTLRAALEPQAGDPGDARFSTPLVVADNSFNRGRAPGFEPIALRFGTPSAVPAVPAAPVTPTAETAPDIPAPSSDRVAEGPTPPADGTDEPRPAEVTEGPSDPAPETPTGAPTEPLVETEPDPEPEIVFVPPPVPQPVRFRRMVLSLGSSVYGLDLGRRVQLAARNCTFHLLYEGLELVRSQNVELAGGIVPAFDMDGLPSEILTEALVGARVVDAESDPAVVEHVFRTGFEQLRSKLKITARAPDGKLDSFCTFTGARVALQGAAQVADDGVGGVTITVAAGIPQNKPSFTVLYVPTTDRTADADGLWRQRSLATETFRMLDRYYRRARDDYAASGVFGIAGDNSARQHVTQTFAGTGIGSDVERSVLTRRTLDTYTPDELDRVRQVLEGLGGLALNARGRARAVMRLRGSDAATLPKGEDVVILLEFRTDNNQAAACAESKRLSNAVRQIDGGRPLRVIRVVGLPDYVDNLAPERRAAERHLFGQCADAPGAAVTRTFLVPMDDIVRGGPRTFRNVIESGLEDAFGKLSPIIQNGR